MPHHKTIMPPKSLVLATGQCPLQITHQNLLVRLRQLLNLELDLLITPPTTRVESCPQVDIGGGSLLGEVVDKCKHKPLQWSRSKENGVLD